MTGYSNLNAITNKKQDANEKKRGDSGGVLWSEGDDLEENEDIIQFKVNLAINNVCTSNLILNN